MRPRPHSRVLLTVLARPLGDPQPVVLGGCSDDGLVGRVVELWRYPLKSARGERVQTVAVDAGGLRGDRTWACLDTEDGTVGSAKHPRRWGRLLEVGASAHDAESEDLPVTVHVAAAAWPAGSGQADAALSAYLGRAVRLSQVVPEVARLHRLLPEQAGLVPDWMSGAGAGAEVVTEVAGARPGGRFVDFAAVHLVTTGALAGLARRLGRVEVAAGRFRPNLVLDAPGRSRARRRAAPG